MNGIIGTFRIGEDISVALDAVTGDTASVTALGAAIMPALVAANRLALDPAGAGTAMAVAPQSPAAAGWILSLSNAQTALMAPGVYGIDARLSIGSSVEITDQTAFIQLSKAALA